MIIIGAGLAGCMAAALDKRAHIIEAAPKLYASHRAVLRFREDKISHALGIPFRKVRVFKSVYANGQHHSQPRIDHINQYSQKIAGTIRERSITNLDTVERFIAPPDLHQQLAEMCAGRIEFGHKVHHVRRDNIDGDPRSGIPIVSTMPINILLDALSPGIEHQHEFRHWPINVARYHIADCDVHQTIYYPGPETGIYRATLTGEDLIVESTTPDFDESILSESFCIPLSRASLEERQGQRYGKIIPLPSAARKELLLKITVGYNIYSLGRFACWRNILLDDVYDDFNMIRGLMKMNQYDLMRSMT